MYGIRAITLGLIAACHLALGAELGGYRQSIASTSTSTSTSTVTVVGEPEITTVRRRFVEVNGVPAAAETTVTKFIDPILGEWFRSLISRISEIENKKPTKVSEAAQASATTTTTSITEFPTITVPPEEDYIITLPPLPPHQTGSNPDVQPRKNDHHRIVSSRVANSTNETATTTSGTRPTKAPPSVGGVSKIAAPMMGAVAAIVAGCVLL